MRKNLKQIMGRSKSRDASPFKSAEPKGLTGKGLSRDSTYLRGKWD